MADHREISIRGRERVTGRAVLGATLAGLAVGGPLLGMMGFCFLVTMTLLLVSSPLLLIFSPLLIFFGFVFVCAIVGFAAAVGMALTGMSLFALVIREFRRNAKFGGCTVMEGLADYGETVKEQGKNWTGNLQ